ncbi:MAG: DUF3619 family protein [Betaproteobacteria bacterium]|nr:DUF3619 family protein [Betaproteobacteria bacterium]MDE2055978.1 DUF3619 family protein [Betaproteobacteria bacterium]
MNDDQIIQFVRNSLNESSQQIPEKTREKLDKIRENALKISLKNNKKPGYVGFSIALSSDTLRQQFIAIVSSILLISAIATYSAWIHDKNEDDQGFLDAKLLASDLPIQAFTNSELSQWLEK